MADKLPLVIDAGVVEQLQSGDVLINQEGTVVWAAAGFGTDNAILRSAGTEFGADVPTTPVFLSDDGQIIFVDPAGNSNVKIGDAATGAAMTTGVDNMLIGRFAGAANTSGIRNMLIGGSTGGENVDGNGNCGVGFGALFNARGDNNVAIGLLAGLGIDVSQAAGASTTTDNNTFIGGNAGNNASQKDDAVNSMALGAGTFTTADNQTVIGNTSVTDTQIRGVVTLTQTTDLELSTDHKPILQFIDSVGTVALEFMSFLDSTHNIGIGKFALNSLTTGTENVAIGKSAGTKLTEGNLNLYYGRNCGRDNVVGEKNTGMGGSTLLTATGSSNTGVGASALSSLTTGGFNTSVGAAAGNKTTTGINNVFIGAAAGGTAGQSITADFSIAIGRSSYTTGDHAIVLGRASFAAADGIAIGESISAAANQIVIGGSIHTETLLFGRVFTGDGAYETLSRTTKTTSASITTETLVLVDATSGDVTITLPPAADLVDTPVHLKKIDSTANSMIIEGDGSETIDGELNVDTAVQYTSITVVSDGTEWWIL